MNLKKNSWHSALVQSTYGEGSLPQSLCPYFWKLLFAILVIPFTFIAHIVNLICRDYVVNGTPSVIFLFLTLAFSNFYVPKGVTYFSFWWVLWGFLTLCAVVGVVALIIWLFCILEERSERKQAKKPNILVESFKAFKGKYCPKITWK